MDCTEDADFGDADFGYADECDDANQCDDANPCEDADSFDDAELSDATVDDDDAPEMSNFTNTLPGYIPYCK